MSPKLYNNPWLGLESYKEGETLYGRDDDIRDLIQHILNDVDTLLYGRSGIGKSSILNAGIFPAARRNGYLPILIRLSHKEDCNYLEQIKDAISLALGLSNNKRETITEIREVVKCKDAKSESLYEYFHRHTFHDRAGKRIKLLVVFDQFEEIFTLQAIETKKRDFFSQLADLLNDIMPYSLQPKSKDVTSPKELVNTEINNSNDIFDDIDSGIKDNLLEYVTDNDIHFVFTIREDFLSEFEYYTSSIPSLKQNRYGLRPISEEQASQIILRPEPGLINLSVAKLIIEKVTGRTDFKLDGIPEIEVDSAVLSLYMNRLYETKGAEGITADLIEQKGEEIISDFYKKAIANIPESSVEYLEEKLINGQGRRDSISVYDAIHKGGISPRDLDILCRERKILRQFNYAGGLRIEYIHDILCQIAVNNREYRYQRKLVEEESKKLIQQQVLHTQKLKRRNRIISVFACILLFISVITLFFFLSKQETTKFTVLLSEDKSINLTDYWKARISVFSDSDTLCVADVDKSNPMLAFDVKGPDTKKMRCEINFLIGDLVARQENNNSFDKSNELTIPISHNTNRILIKGIVASRVGSKAPIYNALVIIDDQLTKTNYKGEFSIYVDSILQDSTIIIRKKGYKSYEGKLKNGVYRLSLNGNYDYPKLAKSIRKHLDNAKNVRIMEGTFYGFEDGDTVHGKAHMLIEISGDSIRGYTYYDKSYERELNKVNSYFLINGIYNELNNTFRLHLIDAVYNEIEYSGHIGNDSQWYGETFDKNTKRGYFIFE